MERCFFSRRRRVTGFLLAGLLAILLSPGRAGLSPFASIAHAEPAPFAANSSTSASGDADDLANLQSRFESVARRVSPAVVAISATITTEPSPAATRSDEINTDKLQGILAKTTRMVGTGFIIAADGYILTNDHVIDEAQQLWITTDEKTAMEPAGTITGTPLSEPK